MITACLKVIDPEDIMQLINFFESTPMSMKIITHGYLSRGKVKWIELMKDEFLRSSDAYVIVVDWGLGANPTYTQAFANIRLVAVQVAYLIHALHKYARVPMSSFHLIGHSLGSHLFGQAGKFLSQFYGLTVERITGLDPAGPFFTDFDSSRKLDHQDAEFVDVIHTDDAPFLGLPMSFGIHVPIGHLDFYPNGGGTQPGCEGNSICQHKLAPFLYIDSIRHSCRFTGVRCTSYEAFLEGHCWGCSGNGSFCAIMGEKATKPKAELLSSPYKIYLKTWGTIPYCGIHYRITVSTSSSGRALSYGGEFGIIRLEVHGSLDVASFQLSERSLFYEPATVYRRVILSKDVGEIAFVVFIFDYPKSLLNPMSWRIRNPVIGVEHLLLETLDPQKSWKYCLKDQDIEANIRLNITSSILCQ